jgi:flagellar biosynthesis/type III secretory pathway M-ring protein FliF/YscJ
VRIPRTYVVRSYKRSNPSAKDPTDADLQPMVDQEIASHRKIVQNCMHIQTEEVISVDVYDDFDTAAPALVELAGKTSGIGAVMSTHGKELVLGVLAVISLFMVSMIVKKGPTTPVFVEPETPKETPRLAGIETVAGIVGDDANPTLDGMELDEDAVKSQQVVHQVATMVKDDPDAAANLVKRWLNRS